MVYKKSELKGKEIKIEPNSIFSKENVNIGRQPEFDYLKTFQTILMVHWHVYEHYSLDCFYEINRFFHFSLGAGGFMFLMGIGMKYSRNHEPKNYISRGFGLLTIAQLLYILRESLPHLISWWATRKKFFLSNTMLVLQGDILTFAGFSFFLFALMKKIKLSDNCILIISIIMNVIAFSLFKIMKSPNNFLLSQILGYFILTDAEADFPLFSYFIYVAMGHWAGYYFLKVWNKDKFYNLILIFCLPFATIYYYIRSHLNITILPEYHSDAYYSLCACPDAIVICMNNLIALAIFHKINILLRGKTPQFIIHIAKNLNQYYFLSYLFIVPEYIFLVAKKGKEFPLKMKLPTLYAFMVFIFCWILININDKYIHFTITTLKYPKRNFVFALIWIATIIIVVYIYPKVEVYSSFWNNYLRDEDY